MTEPGNSDTSENNGHPRDHTLASKYHSPLNRTRLLEKRLMPEPGEENYNMNLDILLCKQAKQCTENDGSM